MPGGLQGRYILFHRFKAVPSMSLTRAVVRVRVREREIRVRSRETAVRTVIRVTADRQRTYPLNLCYCHLPVSVDALLLYFNLQFSLSFFNSKSPSRSPFAGRRRKPDARRRTRTSARTRESSPKPRDRSANRNTRDRRPPCNAPRWNATSHRRNL